jgi:hypothetical protein
MKNREQGMPRVRGRTWLLVGICCLLLAAVVPLALAQTRVDYDLSWWTVDGGGATLSTGEGYRLSGTAGQSDAGVLQGVGHTLLGGFWRGGQVSGQTYWVYLPVVLRGH